jgi:hypothetical protein
MDLTDRSGARDGGLRTAPPQQPAAPDSAVIGSRMRCSRYDGQGLAITNAESSVST